MYNTITGLCREVENKARALSEVFFEMARREDQKGRPENTGADRVRQGCHGLPVVLWPPLLITRTLAPYWELIPV